MGNFLSEIPQLKELIEKGYDSFIETGTYEGSTPLFLVDNTLFKQIHTIELSPYHYLYSTEKIKRYFNNEKKIKDTVDYTTKQKLNPDLSIADPIQTPLKYGNVTCYFGDGPHILSTIVDTHLDTKFVVWLDSHYSGGFTTSSKDFGECPTLHEIEKLRKLKNPPIIIVDDADCFGVDKSTKSLTETEEVYRQKTTNGYPNLIQLFNQVKEIDVSYKMDIFGEKNPNNIKIIFTPNIHS